MKNLDDRFYRKGVQNTTISWKRQNPGTYVLHMV
jgi:hypothetical protein